MRPPEPQVVRRFEDLSDRLTKRRHDLEFHPVYLRVHDADALRVFMRTHVFAVWDFMNLAKALQHHLTCMSLPWLPPADRESARFINEIICDEESDEVRHGYPISHFELYLQAMREEGADTEPIETFIARLRAGEEVDEALSQLPIRASTRHFVSTTMELARASAPEVASAFLFGREQVIPGMFQRLYDHGAGKGVPPGRLSRRVLSARRKLTQALHKSRVASRVQGEATPPRAFELYLKRHIELDGEDHGPMGARMLMRLCELDEERWLAAEAAAIRAMEARMGLWNGVLAELGA